MARLAFGAVFFAAGLTGAAVAGDVEGDWAHPAAPKHDMRTAATAKRRIMIDQRKIYAADQHN
ncbi:hypothetical protein [Bradyrhizobium sp. USDA 3240]